MDLIIGTKLKNKVSGNIFTTIGKPYFYETVYHGYDEFTAGWWKVKARSDKDGKIHHIRLDNFEATGGEGGSYENQDS